MNNLEFQAIIFDLDGTLIDSTGAIKRIWQAWGLRQGIAAPELLEVAVTMRTIEAIRLLAPHLDVEREARYLELAEATDLEGVTQVEGARALLRGLSRGSWGIVTSISRKTAIAKLSHVNLPIPTVLVTADDVQRGKPAPDGYLLASERLGAMASKCVVVEDSPAGIEAARSAGMTVIGLATTFPVEQIQNASLIITRLEDLKIKVNDAGKLALTTSFASV